MQRISIARANIASAFLFAAVPLAFLAATTSYRLFKNVPDVGRESYLEPYNSAKEHLPQLLGIFVTGGRQPAGAATQAAHPPGRSDDQNERIGRDHRKRGAKKASTPPWQS